MPSRADLSPEEREEFDRDLAERAEADRAVVRLIAAEHTGAWLTVGYVALSILGLVHQAMVLRRFGINVVEYAQLSDFLLAAIRDPFVVLASAVPGVAVYLFYSWYGSWSARRNPLTFLEGRRKHPRISHPRSMAALQLMTGLVWATSVQMAYANVVSGAIRRGEGSRVAVSVANAGVPERPFPTDSALVIAVTSGYLFLYFPTHFETRVIPIDNVAYIGRRRVPTRRPTLTPGWEGAPRDSVAPAARAGAGATPLTLSTDPARGVPSSRAFP